MTKSNTLDVLETGVEDEVRAREVRDSALQALATPGSTKVSSLLMEDTVAAGDVSIASGLRPGSLMGKAALFANPFLDGKEEALAIDGAGYLTYLQRDAAETGWLQTDVTAAGKKIKAGEVVVVVHPQDMSVWAVYTPEGGGPQTLRLRSARVAGGTACRWDSVANVIVPVDPNQPPNIRLSHLHVFYQDRTPIVTAIDATGHVVTIAGVFDNLVTQRFGYTVHPAEFEKYGPVDDLAGGRVTVLPGANPAGPSSIFYLRYGTSILRYSSVDGQGPHEIATDATQIAGTYPVTAQSDVGVIYLNSRGELVTWNQTLRHGSEMSIGWAGLGFVTATVWNDVNQMTHVYGQNAAGTLQVIHEAWGDGSGAPFFSSAKTDDGSSVTVCMGLVPKVASFAVDPFPDSQPNELVMHEGAKAPHDKFSIYTQDIASDRWSRDKVRLPSTGDPHVVTHYVSTVTVLDKRGTPMRALPVKVSADTLTEICIEGASYLVGPGHSIAVKTTQLGRVTIASPADSLLPATLHIDATGLANGAIIQPAAAIHDYLAGNSTLPSQNGLFDETALKNAKVGGVPIVDNDKDVSAAVSSTHNVFKVAAGGKPISTKRTAGPGRAKRIHGFSVGASPTAHLGGDDGVVYQEFKTPEELDAHVREIRRMPEYGGILDTFASWVGDIWEGIKNGVVEVFKVVVETTAKVFIWVGKKIVELVDYVIDTVQSAVRTVEAVLSTVVESVHKVVDWLKSLFSLKDIWDTKMALEACFATMWSYGSVVMEDYKKVEKDFFEKQRQEISDTFADLRKRYGGRAVGDAGNQSPPLRDPSGHAMSNDDVSHNPQASWLLDRSAAADLELDADSASPILVSLGRFGTTVTESRAVGKVSGKLGDPDQANAKIYGPTDPDPGAKASVTGLLDLMELLADKALEGMEAAATSTLELGLAVADHFQDVLGIRIEFEPLVRLYQWLARQAERPEPEFLTVGDLFFLIAGFWSTTVYKLVKGVGNPPFPGGRLPVIPPPPGHPAYRGPQRLEEGTVRVFQIVCGTIALLGACFNSANDEMPLTLFAGEGEVIKAKKGFQFFMALGSIICSTALMNCFASLPPVLGVHWTEAGGAYTAAWVIQLAYLGLCLAGLIAFTVSWAFPGDVIVDWAHISNIGEALLGPVVASVFGIAALIAAGIAWKRHNDGYGILAQLILAGLPGAGQILRINFGIGDPRDWLSRCSGYAVFDFFSTAIAGILLIIIGCGVIADPAEAAA